MQAPIRIPFTTFILRIGVSAPDPSFQDQAHRGSDVYQRAEMRGC